MRGRLEGTVTVPGGGWAVSATNGGGGPSTCTIAAGDYGFTALCAQFQTALNASRPNGWTVTLSGGEAGTGLVTINCSSTPWAITFTATDLRTCLGINADIGSRSSPKVADVQSGSIWMPDCPYWAPIDPTLETGIVESDKHQTITPDGIVKTLYGNKKTVLRGLRWDAVSAAVARDAVSATVTGFARWWRWTQLGEGGYHLVGNSVYFFPNADSASNTKYRIQGIDDGATPQTVNGWAGRYRVEIPALVAL